MYGHIFVRNDRFDIPSKPSWTSNQSQMCGLSIPSHMTKLIDIFDQNYGHATLNWPLITKTFRHNIQFQAKDPHLSSRTFKH